MNNHINNNRIAIKTPFNNCYNGKNNGFGPMFYNLRDTNFTKTNDPLKRECYFPTCVVIMNIILYIGIFMPIFFNVL